MTSSRAPSRSTSSSSLAASSGTRRRSCPRKSAAHPLDLEPLLARVPAFDRFATLAELGAHARALVAEFPGVARLETVGRSAEGRPIDLLSVGHGRTPILLVGVPHPNEPIGTLTVEFLARLLCEDAALRDELDVTMHAITVADPDGLVLNEGWFEAPFSPLRYALNYYRPSHREQVEWTFPVTYKTLRFTTPTPETVTVMRVMERVRPRFFYSLHNAGFCGVYFYVSTERPALFAALHALVASQGLPLHRGEPEVPYLRTLAPATYALFGIEETYEYLAATLEEDPAPVIGAGTSDNDWLRGICEAFSFVCELPYYTAPGLEDGRPSGHTRREAAHAGLGRAEAIHAECARDFAVVASRAPEHRLTRSVADYLEKTPKRLAAARRHAEGPEYSREATVAEALDATACGTFYHVLYLGEVHRIAVLLGERALAEEIQGRLAELCAELARETDLRVLPLRRLVGMQAGAGLLALTLGARSS